MEIRLLEQNDAVVIERRRKGGRKWNKASPVRTVHKTPGWRERLVSWCHRQGHTIVAHHVAVGRVDRHAAP